jgi:hypothetical protein
MTASCETSPTITYELVNKRKRRAHIRTVLLRAIGQLAEKKASEEARGRGYEWPPGPDEARSDKAPSAQLS